MTQPAKTDLITVNIDGREIAVPKGTNMIEAARMLGIDIPHYCYHPKLSVSGNCRMCLIEMGTPAFDRATREPIMDPATGKQKIGWIPKPQIACFTNASPGLHVRTDTPLIRECREGVTEFLLVNHPLDCPICDQAGECKLQEQATQHGRGYSRFIEEKNVKPKRTAIGPRVTLDAERCVLCSRCIRFCKEVAKDDVLGFTDRGSFTTISCYPGRQLDNNYSLNTVDVCPVGALTSTDFRFQMRVWFLKQTNSIDTESSVGANTVVWSREGVIYRITPRRNDEVNDTWMADSGRLLYKQVRAENRLTVARIAGQVAAEAEAIKAAADLLKAGDAVLVASGRSTVEEQFLAKRLAELVKAPVSLVARIAQGDKLLVSADRNPNVRGALVTKLIAQLPKPQLTELGAQIDADHVRTILSLGEDLAEAGLTPAQLAKVKIVYLGTHANATSDAAHVVIPALTVFEKDGTFINQQFRVQKFAAAVPGPAGVSGDLSALAQLIAAAGGITPPSTVDAVWALLAAEVPALAGLSYRTLPETGRVIDHAEWAALPFPEGETLHYTPHRSA
ncbi:MAG TPA: 2Fe-2S iron-sulfur cluster-binding protein [Opitutaceae bacterium]|nr:2Fe-2S iron-sulfur cluster-binding protein [Opitutaceae bacterium]HPG18408.1 2Fe-2S iron-sulfur cluster-binding protein [Opitutaceae bacterium]HPO00210.1 2Fe-2S iron-sulfur cluster-binding protein [Opitutaceae bacterium]